MMRERPSGAPDGNEEAQIKKLHVEKEIDTWKTNIWTSRGLKRSVARIAVDSTIGKTLDYPLPATAMSQAQCYKLSKQFESVALPKSVIVRAQEDSQVLVVG